MSAEQKIILGSRGSDLALWQAHYIKDQLEALGHLVELKIIVTQGDRVQHLSFDKLEGKGFFTKEIEDALLGGEIDLAVHSFKDLPTSSPEGLEIAALSYREDPRDVLLIRKSVYQPAGTFGLAQKAHIGTSSARRKAQLRTFFPDCTITDLRGNVPTRVRKCQDGQYDAIVLAAAGLTRLQLDLTDFETVYLEPEVFVPAPAQGVLGLQIRQGDMRMAGILSAIHRPDVAETVNIERGILAAFEGGCHMPLGVYCKKTEDGFVVYTAKANTADELPVYVRNTGKDAAELIQRSLDKANVTRTPSVLITREADSWPLLTRLLSDRGLQVHYQSFIETFPLSVADWPETSWVFFGSRNAVKYALASKPDLLHHKKIGAVGPGTAQMLAEAGYKADFEGRTSDVEAVAAQFADMISPLTTVLLPLGAQSAGTLVRCWQKRFQLTTRTVYDTRLVTETPRQAEILLFTSPSNVEGWLASGGNPTRQTAIAMGKTTFEAMQAAGFKEPVVAEGYSELALASTIFGLR